MDVGGDLKVVADGNSTRFRDKIKQGLIDSSRPLLSYTPGSRQIDTITSATEKYYATRGLIYTFIGQRRVDITHLHIKEWLNGIRNNGKISCPIDKGVEESIVCHIKSF